MSEKSQFQRPRALVGHLTGWIMAVQNVAMNRAATTWLGVQPADKVLEIGFGPGDAIARLISRNAAGCVCGIDPSDVMASQAARKNQAAIAAGHATLLRGKVSRLPFATEQFDRVFSVSTFHDWDDRPAGLQEIRRVLRPGGKLVICLRRAARFHFPGSPPGLSDGELAADQQLLRRYGFSHVELRQRRRSRIIGLVCS